MRQKETHEESDQYHVQPQTIFKTFVADIYESEQIFQSVHCYPLFLDGEIVDVQIKAPIMVKPSAIRDDVAEALRQEYGLTLGNLLFELAPKDYSI